MMANANTRAIVSAKPQMRKADIALPRALKNMIHGYGHRSVRWPISICPSTPEELNNDSTIVAESGEDIDLVKIAI